MFNEKIRLRGGGYDKPAFNILIFQASEEKKKRICDIDRFIGLKKTSY